MDYRLLITIIGLPIYLFLIIYFRRYRQWLLYYLLGAFGLTMLIALPVEYLNWDYYLVGIETFHVTLLGKFIGISGDLLESGRILLTGDGGSAILKIGIECSGVLEAGVLIGLVSFYPVFKARSKLLKIAFGLAVTYLINILRMLIIVVMVAKLGTDYVFLAHAVIGRLFFFTLAIALYWYILTKPTLKLVGEATEEGRLPFEIHHRLGRARVIRRGVKLASTFAITAFFTGSFAYSQDWHKAFNLPLNRPTRPLIYAEETAAEPLAPDETIEVEFNLDGTQDTPKDDAADEMAEAPAFEPTDTRTPPELPDPNKNVDTHSNTKTIVRGLVVPGHDKPLTARNNVGDEKVLGASTGITDEVSQENDLLRRYLFFFGGLSALLAVTSIILIIWMFRFLKHSFETKK